MARTINKFTRTYTEYDPDGAGNGPATWILAAPGAGSGGAISGGRTALVSTAVGTTIVQPGMALAMTSTGELRFADPNQYVTAVCVGLALTQGTAGNSCTYTTDGEINLADWSMVIGSTTLMPGVRYFLDPARPGGLTATCPTASGIYAAPVGVALSTTLLEVEINLPVKQ